MGKKSTKKIEPKKLKALQGIAMAYTFHLIGVPGLNSSEIGYVSERAFKNISKMTPKEEKFVEEKKRTSLKKAKKRF